jgi:hypothetical protein
MSRRGVLQHQSVTVAAGGWRSPPRSADGQTMLIIMTLLGNMLTSCIFGRDAGI